MADQQSWFYRLTYTWWGCLLLALICTSLAIYNYWYISGIEAQPGRRPWGVIGFLYEVAGKTGTVLFMAIPAGTFAIAGIVMLIRREKD